jgi:hypothetical protein
VLNEHRLREVLDYDSKSGLFVWKIKLSDRRPVGSIAGGKTKCGYTAIRIDGSSYLAHRLAWLYIRGVWPVNQIDHCNGNRLDNQIENLREATPSQNSQNEHAIRRNNTSGEPGVFWVPARKHWLVRLVVNGKRVYVGVSKDRNSAIIMKRAAKTKLHPFYKEPA